MILISDSCLRSNGSNMANNSKRDITISPIGLGVPLSPLLLRALLFNFSPNNGRTKDGVEEGRDSMEGLQRERGESVKTKETGSCN